jgi:hypothetical protein
VLRFVQFGCLWVMRLRDKVVKCLVRFAYFPASHRQLPTQLLDVGALRCQRFRNCTISRKQGGECLTCETVKFELAFAPEPLSAGRSGSTAPKLYSGATVGESTFRGLANRV